MRGSGAVIALVILLFGGGHSAFAGGTAGALSDAGRGDLLSAFFGLDGSLRLRLRTLPVCGFSAGGDGMAVIFSAEVDPATLDAEDFRIIQTSGKSVRAQCVTLRPADDPGELRTALLVGEFGTPNDPPSHVEIVGDLMSLSGSMNFKGAEVAVTPLSAGPSLILAERVPRASWTLGAAGECPLEGTKAIVRATWAGGVTKPGGRDIDAHEASLYRVAIRGGDGRINHVAPLAVADLGDNDNNHDLCLGVSGDLVSVSFPAGGLTDPNEDLNPETTVLISPQAR